jgi:hypothetical protein
MLSRSFLAAIGVTAVILGAGTSSAIAANPACSLVTTASIATAVGLPNITKEAGSPDRCTFELWRGRKPGPRAYKPAIAAGTFNILEILYVPSGADPGDFAQFKQSREVQELKELPGPAQTYQPPLFGAASASGHERTGTSPDVRGLWANAGHEKFIYLDLYAGRGRRKAFLHVASKVVATAFE